MPRRLQQKVRTKECMICIEEKPVPGNFPAFTTCNHSPDTCITCITAQAITKLRDQPQWTAFTCPQCNNAVPTEQLQSLLSPDVTKQLKDIIDQRRLQSHENWRQCLNPGCGHGQIQTPSPTARNKVSCERCQSMSCFKHQVPWHEGYTCEEYDLSHPAAESVRTNEELIRRTTKPCPQCGTLTEKNGGCNHMVCRGCWNAWNWAAVPFNGETELSDNTYLDLPGPRWIRPQGAQQIDQEYEEHDPEELLEAMYERAHNIGREYDQVRLRLQELEAAEDRTDREYMINYPNQDILGPGRRGAISEQGAGNDQNQEQGQGYGQGRWVRNMYGRLER